MKVLKNNRIRKIVIISLIIHISIVVTGQDTNCHYVNQRPNIFLQNANYKDLANEIIKKAEENYLHTDTSSLIGISKKEILSDLSFMINNANSTNLNDIGYYCGIVVVLNWMLNNRPDLYAQGVINLTFYGTTKFSENSKVIKLPKVLKSKVNYAKIYKGKKMQRVDIGDISLSDYILGVSLVYAEKSIQRIGLLFKHSTHHKRNLGNFIFANTMPWEMDDYFKSIGINNINKNYPVISKSNKTIEELTKAVNSGKMPILLENHLLTAYKTKNLFYRIFGAHFITIHDFKYNLDCKTISFSYWDYGSVKNHREMSKKDSPLASKSVKQALKRSEKMKEIQKDGKYIEISEKQFSKGLKGYWIPQ